MRKFNYREKYLSAIPCFLGYDVLIDVNRHSKIGGGFYVFRARYGLTAV